MIVRKLEGKERFDAFMVSAYCFHSRMDDPESRRAEIEKEENEDWGAFTEEGVLAARIINNHLKLRIDGCPIKVGGIGAVSTLPEYRDQGGVREIFQKLLPEAYENGEVISTLYPFNHEFYRKQGYETVTLRNVYEMSPACLSKYKFHGKVTRWYMGESVKDFVSIYNAFTTPYNFSMPRNEEKMLDHMKVEKQYQDRKFSYLFEKDGVKVAYLIMVDVYHEPQAILNVQECGWINRDGFLAILGFLGRFTADYSLIRLPLPAGIDLLRIVQSPRAYEIKKKTEFDFMVRVMNVQVLLGIIRKPADCDFTIAVEDELIGPNNGIWHVTPTKVEKLPEETSADLKVNIRALGQMAMGCINLDEAMLRSDVEVLGKEDMLRKVFQEKKVFIADHF